MAHIRICDLCKETLAPSLDQSTAITQKRMVERQTGTPADLPTGVVIRFVIAICLDKLGIDEFVAQDLCFACCNTLVHEYLLGQGTQRE